MTDGSSAIEKGSMAGAKKTERKGAQRLRIASEPSSFLEITNDRFSEWCSSILVKETRQSLKSRQFIWTYFVLILFVGVWTVLGLGFASFSYQSGRTLLIGYWIILGFPLGLIIPFSAYRSLAREYEDGTIHLISITTMRPYQIIIGKFGSSVLQMLIYLSILAPCVMFTYMLRGVSLDQIMVGLVMAVGGSICLTILGLFLAGAFRTRALSVGVSVLFVLFLGLMYFFWCTVISELTFFGGTDWWDPDFQMAFFITASLLGSMAALLLVTSISQISFVSDNRSTWIRVAMMVQQMLFLAVVLIGLSVTIMISSQYDFFLWMTMIAAHYWLIMGFLMNGESASLSRRVQRSLPRSFFSRSFGSLLMPGAGRGFLFSVANLWSFFIAVVLMGVFMEMLVDMENFRQNQAMWGGMVAPAPFFSLEFIVASFVVVVYATWFLAVNYLLMRLIFKSSKREWGTGTGPLVSFLMGALMVALLTIGTGAIHYNLSPNGFDSFSGVLYFHWYLTSGEVQNARIDTIAGWVFIFGIQALVVIAVAVGVASKELLYRPISVPERVVVDSKLTIANQLPPGESIEEIFGDLKPDSKK